MRSMYVVYAILQTLSAVLGIVYYYARGFFLFLLPRTFRRRKIVEDIVLITGGGSGLGRLVGINLAAQGAKIISWDINEKGNEETKEIIISNGGKCYTYTVDICHCQDVYHAANLVKEEVGKVDILINNAGIVTGKKLLDCSGEEIRKTFDVNILSHFWTTKSFLPDMIASKKGHVVTISSIAGLVGSNKLIDYSASKFAAVGFNEALRVELNAGKCEGVHTTLVCPYYTNTGMFRGVRSRLIGVMQPTYVAKEITDAILMREKQLILPFILQFILTLKGFVPCISQMKISNAITGDKALNKLKLKNNPPI